jgi:hypothetical protein
VNPISSSFQQNPVTAYNFCKVHGTLGCTPAVGLKLSTETWTIERLIKEATKYYDKENAKRFFKHAHGFND